MTYVNWPSGANKRFYNYTRTPADNSSVTEYASGRRTVILKNTRFIDSVKCSVRFTKDETNIFWDWYKNTLGGLAGVFACSELKRNSTDSSYYRFKSVPSENTGLMYKEITLDIEEVF